MFTVAIVVSFFGGNMMMAVEFSCMANAITYQEYKKGESAKAFIMGTIQWCPNIGKMFPGRHRRFRPGRHRLQQDGRSGDWDHGPGHHVP